MRIASKRHSSLKWLSTSLSMLRSSCSIKARSCNKPRVDRVEVTEASQSLQAGPRVKEKEKMERRLFLRACQPDAVDIHHNLARGVTGAGCVEIVAWSVCRGRGGSV